MNDLVRFLAGLAADLLRGRAALVTENALLRQQLIVAERKLAGNAHRGSASQWAWRRVSRPRGARPLCSSSRRDQPHFLASKTRSPPFLKTAQSFKASTP
jgi:hypothetical protein